MKTPLFFHTLLMLAAFSMASHATIVPTKDYAGLWKAPSVIYLPDLHQIHGISHPGSFPIPPGSDLVRWKFPSGSYQTLLGPVLKGDLITEDLDFNFAPGFTAIAFVYQDERGTVRPFSLSPSGPYAKGLESMIPDQRSIIAGYSTIVIHAPLADVPQKPFASQRELAAWLAREAVPTTCYFDPKTHIAQWDLFDLLAGSEESAKAAWEELKPLYPELKDSLTKLAWFNIAVHAQGPSLFFRALGSLGMVCNPPMDQ